MKENRFAQYDAETRDLVLAFEGSRDGGNRYFDADQIETIADFYIGNWDEKGLADVVQLGEQLFPDNVTISVYRAYLYGMRNNPDEALRHLHKLERDYPDHYSVTYALGVTYSLKGDHEQAYQYFLKSVSDNLRIDVVYCNIADSLCALGRHAEAVHYYKLSIKQVPEHNRSCPLLAEAWDMLGKSEEGVDYFTKHVADHPFSKEGWHALGYSYHSLKLYEKACDAFEYAIAIDKHYYDAYLCYAETLKMMHQYDRAIQVLHDTLDFAFDSCFVYDSMAQLFMLQGNYQTAYTYLKKAVEQDQSFAQAWDDLGNCADRLGYDEEAIDGFCRAIRLDTSNDIYWLDLVDFFIRFKEYPEAVAILEQSRDNADDVFSFDSRLIYCYFKLGLRNRIFSQLRSSAPHFAPLYPSLFLQYPELAQDPEIVEMINVFTQQI